MFDKVMGRMRDELADGTPGVLYSSSLGVQTTTLRLTLGGGGMPRSKSYYARWRMREPDFPAAVHTERGRPSGPELAMEHRKPRTCGRHDGKSAPQPGVQWAASAPAAASTPLAVDPSPNKMPKLVMRRWSSRQASSGRENFRLVA